MPHVLAFPFLVVSEPYHEKGQVWIYHWERFAQTEKFKFQLLKILTRPTTTAKTDSVTGFGLQLQKHGFKQVLILDPLSPDYQGSIWKLTLHNSEEFDLQRIYTHPTLGQCLKSFMTVKTGSVQNTNSQGRHDGLRYITVQDRLTGVVYPLKFFCPSLEEGT